jgi:hypothetical protein
MSLKIEQNVFPDRTAPMKKFILAFESAMLAICLGLKAAFCILYILYILIMMRNASRSADRCMVVSSSPEHHQNDSKVCHQGVKRLAHAGIREGFQ